jgi:hypothetical protein
MFKQKCSLCGKEVKVLTSSQDDYNVPSFLLLWDNLLGCQIGKTDEIPYPSHVYCEKCIPKVRNLLIKETAENEKCSCGFPSTWRMHKKGEKGQLCERKPTANLREKKK